MNKPKSRKIKPMESRSYKLAGMKNASLLLQCLGVGSWKHRARGLIIPRELNRGKPRQKTQLFLPESAF